MSMVENDRQRQLLLLPCSSLPCERSSFRAAYTSTLAIILQQLGRSRSDGSAIARLDIAVSLPSTFPIAPYGSRTRLFGDVQRLMEEVYRLLCIVAAKEKVDLDFPGGVDARVVMVYSQNTEQDAGAQALCGPLIDLKTFVTSNRTYENIYLPESEEALGSLNQVLRISRSLRRPDPFILRLPCGPSITFSHRGSTSPISDLTTSVTHRSVIVGGTFDHLHIGHKLLLSATVFLAQPDPPSENQTPPKRLVTIGITGDALLINKKHASLVESWETRQERIADFVESILVFLAHPSLGRRVEFKNEAGANGKAVVVSYGNSLTINYVQISDPFGPTITEENITALVISKETRAGGKAVNEKRVEKGWRGLEIFEVDVLDAGPDDVGDQGAGEHVEEEERFESKISSTEIRRRLENELKLKGT